MHKYCKAYHLQDLRQFSGWTEKQEELTDDSICYLWDDFTVVGSPVKDEVIFDEVSPIWQEFCQTTLKFTIPEDLQYAYQTAENEE